MYVNMDLESEMDPDLNLCYDLDNNVALGLVFNFDIDLGFCVVHNLGNHIDNDHDFDVHIYLDLDFGLHLDHELFPEYDLELDLDIDYKSSLIRMLSKVSAKLREVVTWAGGWLAI